MTQISSKAWASWGHPGCWQGVLGDLHPGGTCDRDSHQPGTAGGSLALRHSLALTQLADPALEPWAAGTVVGLVISGTGASIPAGILGAVLPLSCKTRSTKSPGPQHSPAKPLALPGCSQEEQEGRGACHASKEGRLVLSTLPVGPGLGSCCSGSPLGLTLALCLTQLQCQTVPAGHLCVLQLHWSLWLWTMRGLNVTFQARARP